MEILMQHPKTAIDDSKMLPFKNVAPLSEADGPCIRELSEVLSKYNALNRFGICLLHEHFPIDPDEILVESVDEDARTMVIKPVKKTETEGSFLETIWQLDLSRPPGHEPEPKQKCIQGCRYINGPDGNKHYQTHKKGT
jgi:hypothetical protein